MQYVHELVHEANVISIKFEMSFSYHKSGICVERVQNLSGIILLPKRPCLLCHQAHAGSLCWRDSVREGSREVFLVPLDKGYGFLEASTFI